MNDQQNNFPEEQAAQLVARQAYTAPVIQVYGNIRTITQSLGGGPNKDSATGNGSLMYTMA